MRWSEGSMIIDHFGIGVSDDEQAKAFYTEVRLTDPVRASLTTVRASDDLEQMAVRILEIHAAATEVMVDLAGSGSGGVGPVLERSGVDAAEHVVEIVLPNQEGVVLRGDLVGRLVEIQ